MDTDKTASSNGNGPIESSFNKTMLALLDMKSYFWDEIILSEQREFLY